MAKNKHDTWDARRRMEWAARHDFDFSEQPRPYDRWDGVDIGIVRRILVSESAAAMDMYREVFKRRA